MRTLQTIAITFALVAVATLLAVVACQAQKTIDLGSPSGCMDTFTRATPDAPCTSRITVGNKSVLWTEVHGHVTGVESVTPAVWPEIVSVTIHHPPPAKHHSRAPQPHHSHKPRKHGSAK